MEKAKVLVIDDDLSLLRLLRRVLEKASYDVDVASSGAEGLKTLYDKRPDVVVLDVMMPVMDGWQVCKRIRELSSVPILMLTAKSDERDKVRGFHLGVDDYVTKPFGVAEFTARIGALLHRASNRSSIKEPRIYSGKGLVIDVPGHKVTLNGHRIRLTLKELQMLATLAEEDGNFVSTDMLLSKVWGSDYAGEVEHVKRYIWRLRRKIEEDPQNPKFILSERGLGYRLSWEE